MAVPGDRYPQSLAAYFRLTFNAFVIAHQNDTWVEPASVAALIGTFGTL
jgi:hypothetical protein